MSIHELPPPDLAKEPYLTVRVLDKLSRLYGDRGKMLIGIYKYFRWIDDVVDESPIPLAAKREFLVRQDLIISGKLPDSEILELRESEFCNLPWSSVKNESDKIKFQSRVLLSSISDDLEHAGFKPRSEREIRHYNWRAQESCFEIMSLCLNGRDLCPTKQFMQLVQNLYTFGSLGDMDEDLSRSMIELGFKRGEMDVFEGLIQTGVNPNDAVLKIYTKDRFLNEKKRNKKESKQNAKGFLQTNLPLWQKAACYLYVLTRAQIKCNRVRYPNIT